MRLNRVVFLYLFCLLFGALPVANAATLYIDPGIATLYRGDAITASVRLMPDESAGECINAADIVISYPESIVPVDVSIGRSIFSVWIEPPTIDKEARQITMAGGIPNGYCGRVQGDPGLTNVIADIIFRSPGLQVGSASASSSEAVIQFTEETNLYLNDGQGTKAIVVTLSSRINLEKSTGQTITDDWRNVVQADDIPPAGFSISLERDPVAFTGRYFIVFSTTDKQTGISHYEVMEEPLADVATFAWGRGDAPWIRTTSPYVLKDQSLNSTIRVKAIDKAGNEYIATLVPDESLRSVPVASYYYYGVLAGGGVIVLSLLFIVYWLYRRQRIRKIVESGGADSLGRSNDDSNL